MQTPADFPREAVSRLLDASVEIVQPLSSDTHRLWRVRAQHQDLVVRRTCRRTPAPIVDFEREMQIQATAARRGFAPAVIAADAEREILVTEYRHAPVLSNATLRKVDALHRLGERLAGLHAVSTAGLPSGPSDADLIAAYQRALGTNAPPADALRESLPAPDASARVLCHHDVHGANVLGASPMQFIDWEYARCADPMSELAIACEHLELAERSAASLLSAYLGRTASREALQRLRAYRRFARALFEAWLTLHHQ